MVPRTLSEWTVEALNKLLDHGCVEGESFDYKESLPDKRDVADKDRLAKTCAAFANGSGGFLVLGVKDDASAPPRDRIVGVAPDTLKDFGSFPAACEPSVSWEPRQPPLPAPEGRVVHVIHVPRSWKAPHAVKGEQNRLQFPFRTNKGNEFMPYTEVQKMFLGFYEKRLRLNLLKSELKKLHDDAEQIAGTARKKQPEHLRLVRPKPLDTSVLETVLADTYSVTHELQGFHDLMTTIRVAAWEVNGEVELLRLELVALRVEPQALVGYPRQKWEDHFRERLLEHERVIETPCRKIMGAAQDAHKTLGPVLAL